MLVKLDIVSRLDLALGRAAFWGEMSRSVGTEQSTRELTTLIRSKDWSQTRLGSQDTWPPSLRTVLRLMLSSRYSMWLGWGPELAFFYNDAYAQQTLGAKHPWALGQPASAVWAEIWDAVGPRIEHVLSTGEATWDEGLLLFLERNGYPEETYHTFSYSPAPGDALDETAGLFCVVIEETERVIADRRLSLLRDFAAKLQHTKSALEVLAAAEECLTADARDLPFSLVYLLDSEGKSWRQVSHTGFPGEHPHAPATIVVASAGVWPLSALLADGELHTVDLPRDRPWPKGAWEREPTRALLLPIAQPGESRPAGVFIAGLNPHRPFDDSLRSFAELFVGQLAAGLASAGAYQAAQRRAEGLAQIDRAKTAFFSNVSHEFRTPLTLMLGPTEDALTSPERALSGANLETVHRNELRLLKLVNGLLDFARIEAGRAQASYQATDLRALTVDLSSTFRSAIERAGLEFHVQCDELPELFYIDHDLWEKIVLNLLSNALKFTFSGSISVALQWRDGQAELSIADTGVGVAAHELPRLFERFHRVEGTRARTHEGSGIGLALVHELVRLHGGTILVTSEVDHGTTFTISIPAGKAHLAEESIISERLTPTRSAHVAFIEEALRWVPSSPGSAASPSPDESGKVGARILVADDNADMRDYISRLLGSHWSVQAVSDGVEALEAAERQAPDLVLADVMMPRLDGFGLIRELRRQPSTATTPIILLSARAGEEATAEGLRAGADDYLVKPFSASALLIRVEAQLSAARLRETLRKTAEAERQRLELVFRESPAAICILRGPEFVIELANDLILEVWGKGPEIIGLPFVDAVPEIQGQGFIELLQGVLASRIPYHGKEALARMDRARNGTRVDAYFDFVYAPFPGADGALDAVFVHAYEVTEQVLARRNSDQLREAEQLARQDAEAANRLKDEFLATMSHELRTPLNAILGWASLLQRGDIQDPEGIKRGLVTIERNAQAQARLIEDVLDVSRIISGKLRLDGGRVSLRALASAALDVVRPAADARRVELLIEADSHDKFELIGDADRLQQIVWNLLSNAVKFTPVAGRVTLGIERVSSLIRLTVRDSGAGIASEHLPFIFERFRQVDSSTTRKYGGLGLGLAIVRHLVELHGGSVSAASDGAGLGATFTVDLPVRVLRDTPSAPSGETGEHPTLDASGEIALLPGVEVLIVDDDEDSRSLLQLALERTGARVHVADSAASAFALIEQRQVDVIISDIGMPEEDGFSLIRRVRALTNHGDLKAVALTAYAREEDVARALEAGFQRHVAKPTDVAALAKLVAELVGPRAARSASAETSATST
jgi:signal transduction histidine kinase/DNA-binding response OmpR family regulator